MVWEVGWVGEVAFAVWGCAGGFVCDGSGFDVREELVGNYGETHMVVVSMTMDVTSGRRPIVVVKVRVLHGAIVSGR